jgi:hypothetical protein
LRGRELITLSMNRKLPEGMNCKLYKEHCNV